MNLTDNDVVYHLAQNFRNLKLVQPVKYFYYLIKSFTPICKGKKLFRTLLHKSNSILKKQLDLKKFLWRQQIQTTAVMALLTGKQSYLVEKMSQLTIKESTDTENESFDDELDDV